MKKTAVFLLLIYLAILLSACANTPQCATGQQMQPGNIITGDMGRWATIATLCTDKTLYDEGDLVQITLTVENTLNEQITLDGGQQPVMGICISSSCLSASQLENVELTRLVLDPGQSQTILWNWPTPEVDLEEARGPINVVTVDAYWVGSGGGVRDVFIQFTYGERLRGP